MLPATRKWTACRMIYMKYTKYRVLSTMTTSLLLTIKTKKSAKCKLTDDINHYEELENKFKFLFMK